MPVLDIDKLGYQVLETEKEAVFANFGDDLRKPDGSLNRRLLGQRVFGKPEKLAELEAIVHPPVNHLTGEWIERNGDRACVLNAALLHKSTFFSRLDKIILVTAPIFTRFLRAKRRDRLSWREIIKRITSQKDFNTQYLTGNAEIYRIGNPGFTGSRNQRQKLECRIDNFIEGLR